MLRIEMLPAAHGDCLWIEWGKAKKTYRMLIDGGPGHTYRHLRERVLHLPAKDRVFELLVVTHIDADHINGIVRLMQDAKALGIKFKRIWFNGRDQLAEVPDLGGDVLGSPSGEYLSILIDDYEATSGSRGILNKDFPGEFVGLDDRQPALPEVPLPGGMKLTLLSPDFDRLLDLRILWDEQLEKAKLKHGDEEDLREHLENNRQLKPIGDVLGDDGDSENEEEENFEWPSAGDRVEDLDVLGDGETVSFGSDTSPANGSSIALLAEYEKHSALFAGDAFPQVLESSVDKLLKARKKSRLRLDVFKVPHHGSMSNLTGELLDKLSCRHYFISTSGVQFRHPHRETIELILAKHHKARGKPVLHFNYHSATTDPWSDEALQKEDGYVSNYPAGISLEL